MASFLKNPSRWPVAATAFPVPICNAFLQAGYHLVIAKLIDGGFPDCMPLILFLIASQGDCAEAVAPTHQG